MLKALVLSVVTLVSFQVNAQLKIVTTGNNLINPSDSYAADVVIGSDASGGIRHDASMMWWTNSSAVRLSATGDLFKFSAWNQVNANVGLSAIVGGNNYFLGNVGVGTTTPNTSLQISSAVNNGVMVGTSSYPSYMGTNGLFVDGILRAGTYLLGNGGSLNYGTSKVTIYGNSPSLTGGDSYLAFSTGADAGGPYQRMRITDNGNVGIGTNTPDEKLSVNGNIHSKAVRVDLTSWPDYVFDKFYALKPLDEVKDFIDKNRHLPEVPSAEQMVANGLDLGEMNKLLIKKVEELTLYLIEQNKRIASLEAAQKAIKRKKIYFQLYQLNL